MQILTNFYSLLLGFHVAIKRMTLNKRLKYYFLFTESSEMSNYVYVHTLTDLSISKRDTHIHDEHLSIQYFKTDSR